MVEIPSFIKESLDWLGENVPKVSSWAVQQISDLTGQEQNQFVGKIITLLFFALVIFFSTKIGNRTAKIIVIILSVILIIAVIQSFL